MTLPAFLRCTAGAIVGFAIIALITSGLLAGSASTGSNAQTVLVGIAALLSPVGGAAVGAWQARAAGTPRPIVGLAAAAVIAALCGLLLYGANETTSDTLNTLQPIFAVLGAVVGAVLYGSRWVRS